MEPDDHKKKFISTLPLSVLVFFMAYILHKKLAPEIIFVIAMGGVGLLGQSIYHFIKWKISIDDERLKTVLRYSIFIVGIPLFFGMNKISDFVSHERWFFQYDQYMSGPQYIQSIKTLLNSDLCNKGLSKDCVQSWRTMHNKAIQSARTNVFITMIYKGDTQVIEKLSESDLVGSENPSGGFLLQNTITLSTIEALKTPHSFSFEDAKNLDAEIGEKVSSQLCTGMIEILNKTQQIVEHAPPPQNEKANFELQSSKQAHHLIREKTLPVCLESATLTSEITSPPINLITTTTPSTQTDEKDSLKKACDTGDMKGCNNLANRTEDKTEAKRLYLKACAGENFNACFNLGLQEEQDNNILEAKRLYKRSCDGSVFNSCINLGILESKNKNIIEAKKLFKKACDGGYMKGCGTLAVLLESTDKAESKRLYQKGCDGKDMVSCRHFAQFEEQIGNKTEAVRLYKIACDGGETNACGHPN